MPLMTRNPLICTDKPFHWEGGQELEFKRCPSVFRSPNHRITRSDHNLSILWNEDLHPGFTCSLGKLGAREQTMVNGFHVVGNNLRMRRSMAHTDHIFGGHSDGTALQKSGATG